MPSKLWPRECPHAVCPSHTTGEHGRKQKFTKGGLSKHRKIQHRVEGEEGKERCSAMWCEECDRLSEQQHTGASIPCKDIVNIRKRHRRALKRKSAVEHQVKEGGGDTDKDGAVLQKDGLSLAPDARGAAEALENVSRKVGKKRGPKEKPIEQLTPRGKRRRLSAASPGKVLSDDELLKELEERMRRSGRFRKKCIQSLVQRKSAEECVRLCDRADLTQLQYQELRNASEYFAAEHVSKNDMSDARLRMNRGLAKLLHIEDCEHEKVQGGFLSVARSIEFVLNKLEPTSITPEKLKIKIMVDARPEGFGKHRISTLLGYQLLGMGMTLGSSKTVHPLAIFQCGEERELLKAAAPDLFDELGAIVRNKHIVVRGQEVPAEIVLGFDLAATWHMLDFKTGDCPYCMCDTKARKTGKECEERTCFGPESAIPGLCGKSFVFCTLHMLLRIMESLLERLFDKGLHKYLHKGKRIKDRNRLAQMRTVLAKHDLNFSLTKIDDDTIFNIQGMDGNKARKLLDKAELIVPEMDDNPITLELWLSFRMLLDFLNHGPRCDGMAFGT